MKFKTVGWLRLGDEKNPFEVICPKSLGIHALLMLNMFILYLLYKDKHMHKGLAVERRKKCKIERSQSLNEYNV